MQLPKLQLSMSILNSAPPQKIKHSLKLLNQPKILPS